MNVRQLLHNWWAVHITHPRKVRRSARLDILGVDDYQRMAKADPLLHALSAPLSDQDSGPTQTPTPSAEPQAGVQPASNQDGLPADVLNVVPQSDGTYLCAVVSIHHEVTAVRVTIEGCNVIRDVHQGEYLEVLHHKGKTPTCSHFPTPQQEQAQRPPLPHNHTQWDNTHDQPMG